MKTPFLANAVMLPLWTALLAFNTAQAALVQWFKLDEGAVDPTTNIVYSSVSTNTGTTNGNSGTGNLGWATTGLAPVALVPPTNSTRGTVAALSLAGTNAIRTTAGGVLGGTAVPRSVAAWIKVVGTQNANPTIVGWGPNTTGQRFDLRIIASGTNFLPRIELTGSGSFSGTKNVGDGNWHHVVVSYANGTGNSKIYVDGELDTSGTLTPVATTTSTNILIGDSWAGTDRKFRGQIDDVRIYDHALSLEEVQALALAPAITNVMASQTNVTGNATFNSGITAFGAGLTGLTNQWSLNGVDQPGQTNSSFTITGAAVGTYAISVRSGNGYGSMVTNSATFVVEEPSAVITAPSTFPASVSTTYGTASASTSVSVSGSDLTGDITATAPTGLEVSNDDSTWGATTTFTQSGGSASGTLYVRLKNNAPVAGSYNSVNVVLSSPGAESVNVATTASGNTVNPKALNVVNVTALDKMYDGTTAGIVIGSLDTPVAFGEGNSADGRPYIGDALSLSTATGTFASPDVGTGISVTAGTFTLSGAAAGNYTLTQPTGSLTAAIRDTAVWTNPLGGSWTNINNWQNGLIATGTNNTADFTTLSLTANRTVSLDGARPIGNLWFGDQSTNNYGWTIPSGGGPLTLAVNSGTPVVSNSTFTTITVQLAGSQGFQKTGTGILRLNNTANPITGEILVSQGFLQIRDGTVNSPTVFAAETMNERSVRTTGSGTTDLFRIGAANNTTVTWSMPALTLETGGTLRFRNDNTNTITHNLNAAIAVGTGGGKIVNSGTTATGTQTVNLSGALSGSGALEYLANSGTTRRLTISNANNSFSGNWTVAHTSTGTAFLRAGAANSLGTGTVTLNAGATLENNAANGLDSLAGVTLNETNSVLDLSSNAWNNASATLTASNGTIQLGSGASEVGPFTVNSTGTVTLTGTGGSLLATDTDVQAGTLALADGAQLKFRIGNNGVNNQLKGVGAVNLDGAFVFDLSGAAIADGNSWNIVNVGTLTETYGATFQVLSPFVETSAGVWTWADGARKLWTFTEATGVLGLAVVNTPPTAQDITLGTVQGGSATLAILGGKYAPTDADGDTLTLSLPSATTANGAAVSTDGSSITVNYSGVSSYTGTDSFAYTVSDGFGGTVTKTITVIVSAGGTGPNITSVSGTWPNITVNFAGIPGSTYAIERATSASGPWTEIAASVSTGANGLGSYTDTSAPETMAFYRTRYVSTP
ncbi:MAG: beta strand repeat-containing protein [Limisphaerales bacterium]